MLLTPADIQRSKNLATAGLGMSTLLFHFYVQNDIKLHIRIFNHILQSMPVLPLQKSGKRMPQYKLVI